MITDLIRDNLTDIVDLQKIIKNDDLNYKPKRRKTYNFSKYSLPIVFLRDIHEEHLSLADADLKQSNFATELKKFDKDIFLIFQEKGTTKKVTCKT